VLGVPVMHDACLSLGRKLVAPVCQCCIMFGITRLHSCSHGPLFRNIFANDPVLDLWRLVLAALEELATAWV
jgi:hypothetical protein